MDTEEVIQMLNKVYILTAKEKEMLILGYKGNEPKATKIILKYINSNNVNDFYQDLKEENLLSTDLVYKEYM